MRFTSTRDPAVDVGFLDAVEASLPPDGGLFVPTSLPALDAEALLALPFVDRSVALITGLAGLAVETAVREAFDFAVPLTRVPGPGRGTPPDAWALELYHGPTFAFKDFGARFLANVLGIRAKERTVLVATSGDTGAAVAQAFWRKTGVRVVVLYPEGRVTKLQEAQFATLGDNVTALAVDGSFDDCQALVKACFADERLRTAHALTSANSINLARLLAQVPYHFEAVAALRREGVRSPPVIAVPSGNFGNLCAGLIAVRMGLPVAAYVAATNANDTVPQHLAGAPYTPRPSVPTLSTAMDVGAPNNWERIEWFWREDPAGLRAILRSGSATDAETVAAMQVLGPTIDPHGAVGWAVLDKVLRDGEVGVFLATAHPAKFPEAVERATGHPPWLPVELGRLLDNTLRSTRIPAQLDAVARALDRG